MNVWNNNFYFLFWSEFQWKKKARHSGLRHVSERLRALEQAMNNLKLLSEPLQGDNPTRSECIGPCLLLVT